jgi:hypothetical protein
MFACGPPDRDDLVVLCGHGGGMAVLFAIIGVVTISLLGVARWWEEH